MKILLHACCGPCAISPLAALLEEGMDVTLFWFNPNIAPVEEFNRRREAFFQFAEIAQVAVIEAESVLAIPKNCSDCYSSRLANASRHMKAGKFDGFTTTLLVSPYQNHELIKQLGQQHSGFVYRDFRPLFRQGQKQAREMGLYMQKYCGCGRDG